MKNLPRNEFIVRSHTCVRDDKYVILKGFALKNLPPSESTIATVTNRTVEIPHTRPQVSVRNDIIVILRREAPKNLKQIAEDSSYSFGMTSGQKGERFLAYARNNKGLPPSLGTTVC